MRLGGPVDANDPESWVAALRDNGYRAAYCPVGPGADPQTVQAYAQAAREAGIVIAEVGAWQNNPISSDEGVRGDALNKIQAALALADEIGAFCCVNVAGSRGERWDGPHPKNLDADTFALIVDSVREIIDGVRPRRAFYTLEPMPWVLPDTPLSYLRLLRAVDRPMFAVHLDPVNLVNTPERCYHNGRLLRECFDLLGPFIKSVHAKDIRMEERLTVHLEEVRPGLGVLDYAVFLREMDRLDPDIPLMLEHLHSPEDYRLSAAYVREVASREGIPL